MRTSVITRFAKNDRSLSTRRRIAAIATTAVLAGGIQILATDSAWACGAPDDAPVTAPAKPSAENEQDQSVDLHGQGATAAFVSTPTAITAGGPKAEFVVEFTNGTGADYHRVMPAISFSNTHGATPPPSQVTAEVMVHGQWQRVALHRSCDPAINGSAPAASAPLANGHSVRYRFRVGVSADVAKDIDGLQIIAMPVAGTGATLTSARASSSPSAACATSADRPPTAPERPSAPSIEKISEPPATPDGDARPYR
ncbi:hypothetical protein [Streptomyces sp. FH025]|uniref:hypothetical protein n=1 Tax=Streptomyces sp. FH025 TaxID=2815937 RepID=UPI001A9F8456|nr:hypothetical protein [Streptomyces sp. FH025]MBO1419803.1 hypothetical protein [Streptomyces sp. FH025]